MSAKYLMFWLTIAAAGIALASQLEQPEVPVSTLQEGLGPAVLSTTL